MPDTLTQYRTFWRQFRENYHTTGSLLPSSRFLARRLARFVGKSDRPQRILEVGPGTGAATEAILKQLRPDDRLDLVELNDSFVAFLRQRFDRDPRFQPYKERCRILHARVQELPQDGQYDLLISGLPLNNFSVEDVESILDCFRRLLKRDGTLSFFQYIAIRAAKSLVTGREQRQRLRGIGRLLGDLFKRGEIKRDWIWPNVPPAYVHHVRFSADMPGPWSGD